MRRQIAHTIGAMVATGGPTMIRHMMAVGGGVDYRSLLRLDWL
jgi:hypothetical protein